MSRHSAVDRRSPSRGVLGNVRRRAEFPEIFHEVTRVEAAIGPDRDMPLARRRGDALDHLDCSHPFRMTADPRRLGVDDETVAVLHQNVAHVAEDRAGAGTLAMEHRVRIGSRGMRCVRALLAVKVDFAVAPTRALTGRAAARWRILPIAPPSFGRKLFIDARASIRVPSTEKCSVERSRRQPLHLRLIEDGGKQHNGDVTIEQTVTVLREGRGVPDLIIDAKPN